MTTKMSRWPCFKLGSKLGGSVLGLRNLDSVLYKDTPRCMFEYLRINSRDRHLSQRTPGA